MGYADDLKIVERNTKAVEESFLAIEKASKEIGLSINQSKTKYVARGKAYRSNTSSVIILTTNVERVESFAYLDYLVTSDNNVSKKIGTRLVDCYGLFDHYKSLYNICL